MAQDPRSAAARLLTSLRRDATLYAKEGRWYTHPGFWAGATYRLGAFARTLPRGPVRMGARSATGLLALHWRIIRGVHIPPNAVIGPGLRLPHPQNIVIHPQTVLGEDCSVYQETTLGRGSVPGLPTIGDRVMLFPGSRVLGGVSVGDDARLGANAVVTTNVGPRSLVSTHPPRVVGGQAADRLARARDPAPGDGSDGSRSSE